VSRRSRALFLSVVALVATLGPPPLARAAVPPSPCAIRYPSDAAITWDCRRLRSGETLESLFGERWIDVARFNRIDRRHATAGVALKVPARLDDIAEFTPMPAEFSAAAAEPKFVLVDLTEQFLGAYEHGRLVFSVPIASGEVDNATPTGIFRITAAHRGHESSRYDIAETDTPYPMHWALRFHISPTGGVYWMHGRDLPGYPASHGCIGLYDEPMQKEYFGTPPRPVLDDARVLYEWVLGTVPDTGRIVGLRRGPTMLVVGQAPVATIKRIAPAAGVTGGGAWAPISAVARRSPPNPEPGPGRTDAARRLRPGSFAEGR
jgi:lipoprotein-anchoring transpeptidase ErfK/SrfK